MTKIITVIGGPLDGQQYEVKNIGDLRGALAVAYKSGTELRKAQLPIQMRGAKYVAIWDERDNG